MSHHTTPEARAHVIEHMKRIFLQIHTEESSDLDAEIAETASFHSTEEIDQTSFYTFCIDEVLYTIALSETDVHRLEENDETMLVELDDMIYDLMCQMEDDISFDFDDEYDDDNEDEEDE